MDRIKNTAYLEGALAYHAGKRRSENPNHTGSKASDAWFEGWDSEWYTDHPTASKQETLLH